MQLFSKNKTTAILFAVLLPLYVLFTFDHSLWNPDETRDAGIARSMYVERDFVVPHLNGEAFLEKPPLYYWTCAAVYAVTGRITAGTTRLPAALYGLLGLLFIFLIGQWIRNAAVGVMAACITATSFQYFRMSHMVLMDSALAALVAGSFYFYLKQQNWMFAIFSVLAFFTKGFAALAFIGLVILWDLVAKKDLKRLWKLIGCGFLVFVVMVSPWVYGLWKSGGRNYLEIFFIHNNFQRFASSKADHTENPFYLYFLSFPADFLPWTLLLLPALLSYFRKSRWANLTDSDKFPFRWFLAIFIFLTISSSKRSMYLLPALPAAGLITALIVDRLSEQTQGSSWVKPKMVRTIFWTMIVFIVGADIALVRRLDREKTFVPFVTDVKSTLLEKNIPIDHLAGYDLNEMERGVFSFYLEHNFVPIKSRDELLEKMNDLTATPHLLMINKNAKEKIGDLLAANFEPVLTYRPNESKRSYILYETKNKDGLKS